jgi:hypothetical protein
MSWDVTFYKFAEDPVPNYADLNKLQALPLGSVAEVRDKISEQIPEAVWDNYWSGFFLGEDYRFDFFVGDVDCEDEDVLTSFHICIHGTLGDPATGVLMKLAKPYGWTIQDLVDGHLIQP